MERSIEELSSYRFFKAKEDLETSKMLFESDVYRLSLNRSYYAMFHAMRAVTVLDGFDASKHSSIIACFNKDYVKTGIFDKRASKIVKSASVLREKSDYEDFYIASKFETEEQLSNAMEFIKMVEKYLKDKGIIPSIAYKKS